MPPDTEFWGEFLDDTMLNEPCSESFDRMEVEQDPFLPSYDQSPWSQDLEMLLPTGLATPGLSGGANYLPPTQPILDASVPQGLLQRSQPFVQPSHLEMPAPASTMQPASQPWLFLQNQEVTVPEHIRQEKERREHDLAILRNKQAMLEAERDLIEFKDTHGLSGSNHVSSQICPALLPPQSQLPSHPRHRMMYSVDSDPQNFTSDSNDWLMTSEDSVTFDQWCSACGSSTANRIALNLGPTTVVSPDTLFSGFGPDTEDRVRQLPVSSNTLAHQILPSPQLPPDTRTCHPPPRPESTVVSNGATMALAERKRKHTFGKVAADEAARLMKRTCTTISIMPMISVFGCSDNWTRPSKKKTQEQLKNGRKVRAAGGSCDRCWMLKKQCSAGRPCLRCLEYYADRSTSYRWTCDSRTSWTDFSDLIHPGSSAMSVTQAPKAFAAAVAKLKTIPSADFDAVTVIAGTCLHAYFLWLDLYEHRLAKRLGVDGQRQGRLARIVSAVSAGTIKSLLPILFVWCLVAPRRLRMMDGVGDTLLTTLKEMCGCSTVMMLERAEKAHIRQADPFETLTVLALVDAQRRESASHDCKTLPREGIERHQHLGLAAATHLRHLVSRFEQWDDDLGFARNGRSTTGSVFLRHVEYDCSRGVHKRPLSKAENLATHVFESAAISACAGKDRQQPDDNERPPCCCNRVSNMIPDDALHLFSCRSDEIAWFLHRRPLTLDCVDGRVRTMSFHFDSDVILHGPQPTVEDLNVAQIFHYFLYSWIEGFIRWYNRRCSTADPSEQLSGNVKKSLLLLMMIVTALRTLSLYDQFLAKAKVEDGSFEASWNPFRRWTEESVRGRRRWERVHDGFWRQIFRILCVDDDEFDTDSEHEEPGEDGLWESASDMDREGGSDGEDDDADGSDGASESEAECEERHEGGEWEIASDMDWDRGSDGEEYAASDTSK